MGLALRNSRAGYNTFHASPVTDLNGDSKIDEWDEAIALAQKCERDKQALDIAATRHANLDWWLGVLLVLTNALTTASGVSTAAASVNGGSTAFLAVPLTTAGLSAFAGLLAGLQRLLQPAEKAEKCRAAGLEFERIAETLRAAAVMDSSRRPQNSTEFLESHIQSVRNLSAPDAVSDALARFAGC